jgi:predicted PurR-regulated permease PerM
MKNKNNKEINIGSLNNVIEISEKILKIAFIFILVVGTYALTILFKEWNVFGFIFSVLKVLSPLFIGILVAWLLDPVVKWLKKKGVRRSLGSTVSYIVLLGSVILIFYAMIPVLRDQLTDFAQMVPGVIDSIKEWINGIFNNLNEIEGFDALAVKDSIFEKIELFGTKLTETLPTKIFNIIKTLFSGLGNFVIGLIIGFYFLLGFENIDDTLITVLPKKYQKESKKLLDDVNQAFRDFVSGSLVDCIFVFVITSIGLWAIGLKAPLLFGLFCGITNIIPYIGPYIGGIPAVIVGLSQSPLIGILTLVINVVIQFLEGNFLKPIIMSKSTKLHPVTIMVGLLVFGHFWGIIGMVVSTPIISAAKTIFKHFNEKYDIISFVDESVEKEK